jgi:HD-GYP domain-containing protein (c-di-GMP phosphodiesterase class II)
VSEAINLPPEETELLIAAALTHDVGKIFLTDEEKSILRKPGKLTSEEENILRAHAEKSFDYLKEKGAAPLAEMAIRHHPKRDRRKNNGNGANGGNGSGRVDFAARTEKPQFDRLGRILAIVDIFESTGNRNRPYNSNGEALSERKKELEIFTSPDELKVIEFLEDLENKNPEWN